MIRIVVLFLTIFISSAFCQTVLINEVMSSNSGVLSDEDGEYPDWIELYNPGSSKINLSGYGLSDELAQPFKWIFPETQIDSKGFLLLLASGKLNSNYVPWYETIIDWGDYWRYTVGSSSVPSNWRQISFNDNSWAQGKSGFGFGDNDDSTIIASSAISVFIRNSFNIADTSDVLKMVLHVDYDDGFVAYLNGNEIARANIGSLGVIPSYSVTATASHEAVLYTDGKAESFEIRNFKKYLVPGKNVLSIQVHNNSSSSSDLTLIPFLTLGLKTKPENARGISDYLDVKNTHLHTNFKINADGDTIVITSPDGITQDLQVIGKLSANFSYGRKPDGGSNWFLFSQSTPGSSNSTEGFLNILEPPLLSREGGYQNTSFNLAMIPAQPGDTIFYTTDGSIPTRSSNLYKNPFSINKTTVIRARSFRAGSAPGKTETRSYIFEKKTIPVISLSTDPANFFDPDTGIYMLGDNAEVADPHYGANYWMDWERPIHLEIFERDNTTYNADAGVKIYGAWSRAREQKSLALFARAKYGPKIFDYKLFPNLDINKYESFILRNAGNDWDYTFFRDAMMHKLVESTGLDILAYRPSAIYLNGQYWGILNMREKINEHYIAAHHPDVNPDSIDLLESNASVILGSNQHYNSMITFVNNNNLASAYNYEYVKKQMDVDDFITYMVSQIYFQNEDWPGNNIKYWRAQKPGGKWRWILYDTDFGFSIYQDAGYANNTLEMATAVSGPEWPNPPWSTLLLRKLLTNTQFRNDFINRYADFSNTIFQADTVIKKIREIKSVIETEIVNHFDRWNAPYDWEYQVTKLETFASLRNTYMRNHFIKKFSLNSLVMVKIKTSSQEGGTVKLNSVSINDSFEGIYFKNIPLKITATPKPGYRFERWEGMSDIDSAVIEITPSGVINLTAVFTKDDNYRNIVINEINYNSSPEFDTDDWIELYNNSGEAVNISGWNFRDEDDLHNFLIPENTILKADEYLILCRDTVKFSTLFPNVKNRIGSFNFGLNNSSDKLRLFDEADNIIDSLTYTDKSPWPENADGSGKTLSLKNPELINSDPTNWTSSISFGTPAQINDVYTGIEISSKNLPTQYSLMQNYPNPFNPSTIIGYQLAVNSYVTLKVYDILGNEIATLVNEDKPAGVYNVEFSSNGGSISGGNTVNLSSGIYFYRLNTTSVSNHSQNFTSVKKMLLLK